MQEDKLAYQVAAKEALQKLHAEKLEALAATAEQERARVTAEEEAQLAREILTQTQMELTVDFDCYILLSATFYKLFLIVIGVGAKTSRRTETGG